MAEPTYEEIKAERAKVAGKYLESEIWKHMADKWGVSPDVLIPLYYAGRRKEKSNG